MEKKWKNIFSRKNKNKGFDSAAKKQNKNFFKSHYILKFKMFFSQMNQKLKMFFSQRNQNRKMDSITKTKNRNFFKSYYILKLKMFFSQRNQKLKMFFSQRNQNRKMGSITKTKNKNFKKWYYILIPIFGGGAAAIILTPISLMDKKSAIENPANKQDKVIRNQITKIIDDLNDEKVKDIDDWGKIQLNHSRDFFSINYSHEIFKEHFNKKYILNKIIKKFMSDINENNVKNFINEENIEIIIDREEDWDRIIVKIKNYDKDDLSKVKILNFRNYKWYEEIVIEKLINKIKYGDVADLSKEPSFNKEKIKNFLSNDKNYEKIEKKITSIYNGYNLPSFKDMQPKIKVEANNDEFINIKIKTIHHNYSFKIIMNEEKNDVNAITIVQINDVIANKIRIKDKIKDKFQKLPWDVDKIVNNQITINGVAVEFTKWMPNYKDGGEISWTVKLTKGNATRELSGKNIGWKTTEMAVKDINQYQINEAITAITNKEGNKSQKLPSDVPQIGDNVIDINGIKVEFTSWVPDDKKGEINWTVCLKLGDADTTLSGVNDGYWKEEDNNNKTLVEGVTETQINEEISKLADDKSKKLPIDFVKPNITINGVAVEFINWTPNYNDGGEISWTVKLTKGNATRELSGKNIGWKTTKMAVDEISIDEINAQLDILANKNSGKSTKNPWDYWNNHLKYNGNVKVNGVTIEFTKWDANDDGKVTWSAKAKLGNAIGKILSGENTGWKEKDVTTDEINDAIFKIFTNKSKIPSEFIQPKKNVIKIRSVTVEFIEWIPDDINGKIEWKAKLTKNGVIIGELSGTSTDYFTKKDSDTQKILDELPLENSDRMLCVFMQYLELNKRADLKWPSYYNEQIGSYSYGTLWLSNDPTENVTHPWNVIGWSMVKWVPNDDKGEVYWEVKLYYFDSNGKTGKARRLLSGVFKGFKTSQNVVDAVTAEQINKEISKLAGDKSTKLPSEFTKIDDNAITINGVAVKFTSWSQDDDTGIISWEATLTKGTATGKISENNIGFKTN